MDATLIPVKWNALHKMAFRFFAVYLLIYIFPFPFNFLAEGAWQLFGGNFDPFMNWVAHKVLHMTQTVNVDNQNGSGDTSYYYVQTFVLALLAIAITIIWSIADRRRDQYLKFLYWTKVIVRYYLAFMLITYGLSKFNNGQFPAPDLSRLMQPYGKSSPMGLAWTFLGFSKAFGTFMGIAECAGGILILFRRTTLFGACIATTIVTNIVMVNFCYDVPVKIFSSHLLLMCLFILASEGSRFLNLFIFNKPVAPLDLSPVFQNKKMRTTRIVLKTIVIIGVMLIPLNLIIEETEAYGEDTKPPLYGIYNVKTFTRNTDTIPPLNTDSTRWNKLIIQYAGYASVQNMTEKQKYYGFEPDTAHHTITMYSYKDTSSRYTLSYTRADSSLYITGKFEQDSIYVRMERFDEQKYLLTNRGFHWINEYPFNR